MTGKRNYRLLLWSRVSELRVGGGGAITIFFFSLLFLWVGCAYQMSRAILELGHCQASSIKICCDRRYNGGGWRGTLKVGGTLGGRTGLHSCCTSQNEGQIQCCILT